MKLKLFISIAVAGVMTPTLIAPIQAAQDKSIFELGVAETKHPQTHRSKGGKL